MIGPVKGWRIIVVVCALLWGGVDALALSYAPADLAPENRCTRDLPNGVSRARYFDPNTGRFWTMDTDEGDEEDPLSLHKYQYCEANPVDGVDPSGDDDLEDIGDSFVSPVAPQIKRMAIQVTAKSVDVYVWDGETGAPVRSVGHVMATEHNSKQVILSQFPFKKKQGGEEGCYRLGQGFNRKVSYDATFKYEDRMPNNRYYVVVPQPSAFYATATQQASRTYWNWDPTTADQTQCSTAVFLSLKAGGVPFGKDAVYSSGTLMPSTFDKWMTEDSANPKTTGVNSISVRKL
jgi:RHS repeat-associated protein